MAVFSANEIRTFIYASTDSKPNVHVQDDSLQWKEVEYGIHADLKFKCVDLCL